MAIVQSYDPRPKNRFDVLYAASQRPVWDEFDRNQAAATNAVRAQQALYGQQIDAQERYAATAYQQSVDWYNKTVPKKSNCKSFLGFGCGSEGFTDFWGSSVKAAVGLPPVPSGPAGVPMGTGGIGGVATPTTFPTQGRSNDGGILQSFINLFRLFGGGSSPSPAPAPARPTVVYDYNGNPVIQSQPYAGPTSVDYGGSFGVWG